MRIARNVATLVLLLAATACGTMPTEPSENDVRQSENAGPRMASPKPAVPLKSGNTIGSGT